jgi:hypothetical protein
MYNYKIGYYSCEESEYFELSHKKKFSNEEITEMIATICRDLIEEEKKDEISLKPSFQYMVEEVKEGLIAKYNFEEVKYEVNWSVFGWADLLDENDWKEESDETLVGLRKRLNEKRN